MRIQINDTKGFTLIEVLASIVLLSIVIVSFMSLFPQMTLMNNKTEENLQAANVGKELLVKLRNYRYGEFDSKIQNLLLISEINDTTDGKEYVGTYKINNSNIYNITVTLYSSANVSGTIQTLYRFKIEVKDEKNFLTTTYGYIKS